MMQAYENIYEDDFIIWNAELGYKDFVYIGHVNEKEKTACLEEPYDMVGPFSVDDLYGKGQIQFEACMVMTLNHWKKNQDKIQQEALKAQEKLHKQFAQDRQNFNAQKRQYHEDISRLNEKRYRSILNLPSNGVLDEEDIKTAFKTIAKQCHPDVGGSHEEFLELTEAKDALLKKLCALY